MQAALAVWQHEYRLLCISLKLPNACNSLPDAFLGAAHLHGQPWDEHVCASMQAAMSHENKSLVLTRPKGGGGIHYVRTASKGL